MRQGINVQHQLIVNSAALSRYGSCANPVTPTNPSTGTPQFTQIADFNFGYQPITSRYPSAALGTFVVASGDTLAAIAKQAYGDAQLGIVSPTPTASVAIATGV